MDKHTPTPWISKHPPYYSEDSEQILCKVDDEDNGIVVASYVRKVDAAFIVRACNSHERLVSELHKCLNNYANGYSINPESIRETLALAEGWK